jgi:hypothetical protein
MATHSATQRSAPPRAAAKQEELEPRVRVLTLPTFTAPPGGALECSNDTTQSPTDRPDT